MSTSTPIPLEPIFQIPTDQVPGHTVHDAEFRLFTCFFAFLVYGMNDGAPGALVPLLEAHYSLPYSIVSLIFGPMAGCIVASFSSNQLHHADGRRGVAALATWSYTAAYIGMALHPPFGLVVPLLMLTGYGSGLMNGSWNSWVGGLVQGSTLLGFLHGCWGPGATLAPVIVSALVSNGSGWWVFYYIMASLAASAAVCVTWAFWSDVGGQNGVSASSQSHGLTLAVLKDKVTLLLSAFMLIYVGAEVTIDGWLFTFMMSVRNGSSSSSSLVASGFWIGITVGRFVLGWITGYVGEKLMVSIHLIVAIGLELGFWLGGEFVVSAVMIALVGLSIGMIMPSGIHMMPKLLPPEKHIVSVGFGTAFAISGSAIFPFAVGALAQARGVQVLQPSKLQQ
ncbi:hypothetical protein QQX98_007079 [Neonectria punicea]|uniref:Major facilitator superfamily (MFS) profile domain-containing protein n=1 Tax=Neonectria punicea TaxID=979145 RepID=A0ABR1GZK4_9HYPO